MLVRDTVWLYVENYERKRPSTLLCENVRHGPGLAMETMRKWEFHKTVSYAIFVNGSDANT
jgi:hypothetical protein